MLKTKDSVRRKCLRVYPDGHIKQTIYLQKHRILEAKKDKQDHLNNRELPLANETLPFGGGGGATGFWLLYYRVSKGTHEMSEVLERNGKARHRIKDETPGGVQSVNAYEVIGFLWFPACVQSTYSRGERDGPERSY